MKIAVIYNRESNKVINLFGQPNREKYGLAAIRRVVDALKKAGHQVVALEGDKDLIDRLEEFMPRTMAGERPGMVFNLSYGIQGQARYTHVPGMLEMLGLPYVGSGPLAHSLALDKVVAKMLFVQHGLPTPRFAVLDEPGFELPELDYPLIVKPKNESVSFGIRVVHDEADLREAAQVIFDKFDQPVLVEQFIDGREINVGLLGNGAPEALLPAEIVFGDEGPKVYTEEDKRGKSGRTIKVECPAPISEELTLRAQEIATKAFKVLGCFDCARVDMRLDDEGNLYILEVNSLPSLGEHGSYTHAAAAMGLDFAALVNRLVEVASSRYFGTPKPLEISAGRSETESSVFDYLTRRRDKIERTIEQWVGVSSRTQDPVGLRSAAERFAAVMKDVGMAELAEHTERPWVHAFATPKGFVNGTLVVLHLDVPFSPSLGVEHFHREPEWLYGEGIGSSRAPLAVLEHALRALKNAKRLRQLPIGVLAYADEGRDCEESGEKLAAAMALAKQVIVLRPGNPERALIHQRRGQRRYRLVFEGRPTRLGQSSKQPPVMRQALERLDALAGLSHRKDRVAVSAVDVRTEAYPRLLPHRIIATLQTSFPDAVQADRLETKMREIIEGHRCDLALLSDRPAMTARRVNQDLLKRIEASADKWQMPIATDTSLWPSVAGLVPSSVPVVCGMGPVVKSLSTGREAVSRISVVERTLLLSDLLLSL